MFNDLHLHHKPGRKSVDPKKLVAAMDQAGVEKLALMSWYGGTIEEQAENIEQVARIAAGSPDRIYPLAWVEPAIGTPLEYLEKLVTKKGFRGFKMIPNRWYPYEERLVPYYEKMVALRTPCLFHSGILYFHTLSSKYCRPVFYEDLFRVSDFRFALAHISWPWTAECLALSGQWRSARDRGETSAEFFIDITPGTPEFCREEILGKLLAFGSEKSLVFGTDGMVSGDDSEAGFPALKSVWKSHGSRDRKLFRKLSYPAATVKAILSGNFLRFFGEA